MIIKVTSYFSIDGKFSIEESNELIRDVRSSVNKFLLTHLKGSTITLPNGKIVNVEILSEAQAKDKLIGTASLKTPRTSTKDNDLSKILSKYTKKP